MLMTTLMIMLFTGIIAWAMAYPILLGCNNLVWGIKGFSMDKTSLEYRKRKKTLRLIAIPLAVLFVVIRSIQLGYI